MAGLTLPLSRWHWICISLAVLVLAASADYLTGYELLFSVFYLVSISLATWFAGGVPGVILSIISVVCSFTGDLASGARYSNGFVPWWNMLIALSFYLAMVVVLAKLRAFQHDLERRVEDRTSALQSEIKERERLEVALLEVSENEQRRIGHDLHDGLCQHLTGTALAAEVLSGNLESQGISEAASAQHLVGMVEEGIDMARSLARGLSPVELDMESLMMALRELARNTSEHGPAICRLHLPEPVLLNDSQATTQLFRIAQEAVRNAVRHSGGHQITIGLAPSGDGVLMTVSDDGRGLPAYPGIGGGMGMNIMRYRAKRIGAEFEVHRLKRGTRILVKTMAPGTHSTTEGDA